MATPIEALESKRKLIEEELDSSPTAYVSNTTPKSSDLDLSVELAAVNSQIEDLKSKQTRNRWYGTDDVDTEDAGEPDGLIMGTLRNLMRPLNVVAGTAQHALGKGTKPTLAGNVNEALKTGLVAGDVLRQFGVPRGIQVPLGFALDVMFDPVNWLTAGTSALIPRTAIGAATGLKKGGLKGAVKTGTTGLTSNLQKKAFTATKLVPFAKKSEKYSQFRDSLGKKAIAGAEEFDALTGKTVADRLGKLPYLGGIPAGSIGNRLEDIVRGQTAVPGLGFLRKEVGSGVTRGDMIADFFKYSTRQAAHVADLKDKVFNLAQNKGIILERSAEKATFKSIDEYLKPDAKITLKDKIDETAESFIREADGTLKPEFARATVEDSFENAKQLLDIAGENYNLKHLVEAYKVTPVGKTGVTWYDNAIEKLKATTIDDIRHGRLGVPKTLDELEKGADELVKKWNSFGKVGDLKPFNKLLSAYPETISVFKLFKVPLSAAAHVRAILGNPTMGAMMGIPVHSKAFLKELGAGVQLTRGKMNPKGFKDMFFDDFNSWIDFIDKHPNRFRQMTGIDVAEIRDKIIMGEDLMKYFNKGEMRRTLAEAFEMAETGTQQAFSDPKLLKQLEEMGESFGKLDPIEQTAAMRAGYGKVKTPSETLRELRKDAPIRRSEEAGSWAASELYSNMTVSRMTNYLEKAAETSGTAKILHAVVKTMPKWYERIDQSYKIGTTSFLTKVGLTEGQLITVSRTVPINMATDVLDPVIKGGEKFYRLTPLKASEVAVEAYMNYAAMPDFVRTMRALPIAGVPFLSFQYAMAVKTGKTIINNPSLFNKVGFILNEMNAGRTPQENAALEEKYNNYLKSPTVVRLAWTMHTDVKDLVPYYTMNMFNPSDKNYDDSFRSQLLKGFDKVPLFQDPVGQIFKDYIIQPWVLSGSGQVPQGMFGQPLYPSFDEEGNPIKAGLGTRAFYGTRTLAEAFVPGVASYLGLPLGLTGMSPEVTEYIPSYGIRNVLNATQGRSSIGAKAKENAALRTLRALFGRTGIPLYNLDASRTKKLNK